MNDWQKQTLNKEIELVKLELLKLDNRIKDTELTLQKLNDDKVKILLKLKELEEQ